MRNLIFSIAILAMMVGCGSAQPEQVVVETHVLHEQDVKPLSPDSVLSILKSGNQNFVERHPHERDIKAQLIESAEDGQYPMAIVLSCIDSRVPVEYIFDMGLGDIFVTRVAGNVISNDILGSMEYACEHAGSKVVLVLGHESCGAVHAACEGIVAGNMTEMLAKIHPAIETVAQEIEDHHSAEFLDKVVYENVKNMISLVRSNSEILSSLEAKGEIAIVGGVLSLHTGEVEFL